MNSRDYQEAPNTMIFSLTELQEARTLAYIIGYMDGSLKTLEENDCEPSASTKEDILRQAIEEVCGLTGVNLR
jgi:hypothetical protein